MAPHPDACFGYRCDPRLSTARARAIEVPQGKVDLVDSDARIDLSGYAPAARYQGSLGACTAHAGAAAVRALMDMAAREGLFGGQPFDVSTLGVYQLTLDRTGHRGVDYGASGTEMLRTLARGFPREDAWPYSEVLSRDLPPLSAMTSRRVVGWRQVPHTVRAIRTCLALSCPVLIGIPVFDGGNGMASPRAFATGEVREPASGDELSGWHMVTLWTHDPKTRSFTFQNWWRGFGDDRCLGTIPEDYVVGRSNEILSVESVR